MRPIDKLFALISIPAGGVLLILGVIGAFTGFEFRIALPPIAGVVLFIFGWSLCFSLARFWRLSLEDENLQMRTTLDTPEFREFLRQHPEFIEAEPKFQNKLFQNWRKRAVPTPAH
jgi:hypothetical protein